MRKEECLQVRGLVEMLLCHLGDDCAAEDLCDGSHKPFARSGKGREGGEEMPTSLGSQHRFFSTCMSFPGTHGCNFSALPSEARSKFLILFVTGTF